jgi:parallel beta-helix repeat (two copies)
LKSIYANTATNNTLVGISLGGTQNEIGGNTAVGNGREDMFDSAPNCDDNRWLGNRFVTANQSCIQ